MKTPKINIVCGIELETEYNIDLLGVIRLGSHHGHGESPFGEMFSAEGDGSVSTQKFRNANGGTAEIISKPFAIDDYAQVLNSFKNEAYRRVAAHTRTSIANAEENYKLDDLFCFNGSTGAHLHLSLIAEIGRKHYRIHNRGEDFVFKGKPVALKMIPNKLLNKLNEDIMNAVENAMPKTVSDTFKRDFFRGYSKKSSNYSTAPERYYSWNFQNAGIEHLEFRSFHLHNVTTWANFFKIYEVLFTTIKETLKSQVEGNTAFKARKVYRIAYKPTENNDEKVEIELPKGKFGFDEQVEVKLDLRPEVI